MPIPNVKLELKNDFLPLEALRRLMGELAPHRQLLLDLWQAAYRRAFDGGGYFDSEQVERYMAAELDMLFECVGQGTLTELWARLQESGRRLAEDGAPYGELVITMSLLEESVVEVLTRNAAGAERALAAYLAFDKLSHYRITKLAEAYFYRYVELIQEKTRELAEEQEKHEWSLMRAEKLAGLGQLAGGVAHELNNPLATIAITVEDLEDALKMEAKDVARTWPDLAPALARIRTSVTRCVGVIGGMLDLARNRPPTNEEFRPNDLVTKVAEVASFASKKAGKEVQLTLDPDLAVARSDPRQLQQLVMALVSNAVDAVEAGGTVEVRTRRRGEYFVIEVEDSGCGIPPENLERVFEPFFTTKPPGKGTGLGLSMAYSTARRLKGKLTLDSAVGRGTTVRLMMPLVNDDVG